MSSGTTGGPGLAAEILAQPALAQFRVSGCSHGFPQRQCSPQESLGGGVTSSIPPFSNEPNGPFVAYPRLIPRKKELLVYLNGLLEDYFPISPISRGN